jgi:hypothetical protein
LIVTSHTFSQLFYRYWFYGWLFRDVNQGTLFERAAAARHNQSLSRWLPTYLLRWTVLGVVCFSGGLLIETLLCAQAALLPYAVSTLAVPVNVVTLAAWVGLRVMPLG